MQTDSNNLIAELLLLTEHSSRAVRHFKTLSLDQLHHKNSRNEWSILECIEHLNMYGDYYLPEIEKQMIRQKNGQASPLFRSGLLGNYFARLMQDNGGKIKKMKAPKDKTPVAEQLSVTTLDRFLKQQERLVSLLGQARTADLTRTRIPISIARWIRLRLGDTFRFFIYHIERHIRQAGRVLQ